MRKELFEAIKERLTEKVPEVVHIDLWNHNVEFIEQEDNWARPAVFIEFGAIDWALSKDSLRGRGLVRIHIVTDWTEGGQEAAFDLSGKVFAALNGLSGEAFNGMVLVETVTNHNHEEILESIDAYVVRYLLAL